VMPDSGFARMPKSCIGSASLSMANGSEKRAQAKHRRRTPARWRRTPARWRRTPARNVAHPPGGGRIYQDIQGTAQPPWCWRLCLPPVPRSTPYRHRGRPDASGNPPRTPGNCPGSPTPSGVNYRPVEYQGLPGSPQRPFPSFHGPINTHPRRGSAGRYFARLGGERDGRPATRSHPRESRGATLWPAKRL